MGGYYDAGDHVKFGLPMAYSVTMLSWGTIEFRKEIAGLDQMGHTLAAIKWGTDYFIKSHAQPDVLWGQVSSNSHIIVIFFFNFKYISQIFIWCSFLSYHNNIAWTDKFSVVLATCIVYTLFAFIYFLLSNL